MTLIMQGVEGGHFPLQSNDKQESVLGSPEIHLVADLVPRREELQGDILGHFPSALLQTGCCECLFGEGACQ